MAANPDKGVADLQAIYRVIKTYRARTRGVCTPNYISSIITDASNNPTEYGFPNRKEVEKLFHNSDSLLSDSAKRNKISRPPVLYSILCGRPDGTYVSDPKAGDTRDVLAWTPIYVYENTRLFRGEKMTYNPVGVYLVLWDDGQVEKIPYHKVVFTRVKDMEVLIGIKRRSNGRILAFPGQAGLSKDAITYDQMWQEMGMKRGPRGKEGGKGESPADLAIKPKG